MHLPKKRIKNYEPALPEGRLRIKKPLCTFLSGFFNKRLNFSKLLFPTIVLFGLFFLLVVPVFAQQSNWQFDPVVTEVGKNSERARQLIYWIFTHPPIYALPVLAQIWSLSRNVVYALFILVVALTGLAYVLARREGTIGPIFSGIASPIFGITIPRFFFRIGMLLIYVTFSYLIILGLVQSGEIMSRFFIEKFQGCRLFNISFTSDAPVDCTRAISETSNLTKIKQIEKNYTTFVGFRDSNVLSQESANTGLFIVRATTFTYNVMAVILILRQVVMWFLMMVSPFLAILLPFVFIRNTGYIWIGVFLQWLFYGPLVSLFIAGLSQIWIKGIPYAFNFSRVNKEEGQIFPTAINILYGGPAQVLSPTNSANYIDTYVEYIVALVMLWVAMLLPWLLLRIFRDYCCDVLKQNQATLVSIFDKIRGVGTPPPPTAPELLGNIAMQLPFRKPVEEVSKVSIKRLEDVYKSNTYQLTRQLSLSVNSLAEVARFEMNKSENQHVVGTLNRIANPYRIPLEEERKLYTGLKTELEARAQKGDKEAQKIISAAFQKTSITSPIPVTRELPEIATKEIISSISKETNLSSEKVREVLRELPKITVENQVNLLASQLGVTQTQVQQLLQALPQYAPLGESVSAFIAENPEITQQVAQRTGLTEEKVKEVFEKFSETTLSKSERMERLVKEGTISSEKIKEVLGKLPNVIVNTYPQMLTEISQNKETVSATAKETMISQEKTTQILEAASANSKIVSKEGEPERYEIDYQKVSSEVNLPLETVKTVIQTALQKVPETAPKLMVSLLNQPQTLAVIAQETGLSKSSVEDILRQVAQVPPLKEQFNDQVSMVAEMANLSEVKVKEILGTLAATRLEQPVAAKPSPTKRPQVSVEDYEEVRNMWTNHYKQSEVPVTEGIKNRSDWLNEDVSKLTNVLNLLTSLDPRDKEKGMKEVASILPFLLLGGFSDLETVIYLKAKLQAAKTVLTELEEQEKIKEEAKKEEVLVEVPAEEKKEEVKTFSEQEQRSFEPEEVRTEKPKTLGEEKTKLPKK